MIFRINFSLRSQEHYKRLYTRYKKTFGLKKCSVLLGDISNVDPKIYTFVKKREVINLEIDYRNIINSPRTKYKCEYCGTRFKDYFLLESHRQLHTNGEESAVESSPSSDDNYSSSDEETSSESELEEPPVEEEDEDTPDKYFCKICTKGFKFSYVYASHMRNHKQYVCSKCSSKFITQEKLNSHMKNMHNVIGCPSCPQVFYSQKNLDLHISTKHKINTEIWKCDVCNIKFNSYDQMVEHNKSQHMLSCEHCNKTFSTYELLTAHRFSAHKSKTTQKEVEEIESDDSTTKCDLCTKSFDTEEALQKHLSTHFSIVKVVTNTANISRNVKGNESEKSKSSNSAAELPIQIKVNLGKEKRSSVNALKQPEPNIMPPLIPIQEKSKELVVQQKLPKTITQPPQEKSKEASHKCTLCNKMYTSVENLNNHLKEHITVHNNATILNNTAPIILNNMKKQKNKSSATQNVPTSTVNVPIQIVAKPQATVKVITSGITTSTATTSPIVTPNIVTSTPVVLNQNQPKLVFYDDKPYLLISQQPGGTQLDSGIINFITTDALQNQQSLIGGQNPIIQTIPNIQPINNFLQPAINQTIVLPNTQNSSQISITNKTYNTTRPDSSQEMTNIYYTSPIPQTSRAENPIPQIRKTYSVKDRQPQPLKLKSVDELPKFIIKKKVAPKILQKSLLKTVLADPGVSKQRTVKAAAETIVATIETSPEVEGQENYKPKIFLKPLSQLLEKPADPPKQATVQLREYVLQPQAVKKIDVQPATAAKQTEALTSVQIVPQTESEVISSESQETDPKDKVPKPKKLLKCTTCNVTVRRHGKLLQHNTKYKCKICSYSCCKSKTLDAHYADQHNYKNRCASCDMQFATPNDLQLHKKNMHLCLKCNRCYFDLNKHKLSYKCLSCEFSACNSSNLDAHYKFVHKISTRCAPCNIIFYSMDDFKKHKQEIHYCDKCQTFKMDLNIHKTFCTGIKKSSFVDNDLTKTTEDDIIELDSD